MSNYFSHLPNIKVGIPEKDSSLSNYIEIKNIFRRVKPNLDELKKFTYFEKYSIQGDEKPYQVSKKIYGTIKYEWLILLLNNITNVYTDWPLSGREFENMMAKQYGTRDQDTRHWETKQIIFENNVVLEGGIIVNPDFKFTLPNRIILTGDDVVERITNYEYEMRQNEKKRDIYLPFPGTVERFVIELQQLLQYYESIDTRDAGTNSKNSGDEQYYDINIRFK